MRPIFIFLFISVFALSLSAQNTFHKNFSKLGEADFHKMIMVHDSGFVLSGMIQQTQQNLLIRTDANGDTLWTRLFSYLQVHDIVETYDNGIFMTGVSWDTVSTTDKILALKIDSIGNVQWAKRFANTAGEYGDYVCQTADSGLVIVAQNYVGSTLTIVLKLNKNGNFLWKNYFYLNNNCHPKGVLAMPTGGVAVLAEYFTSSFIYPALLRINDLGNLLWAKEVHSSTFDVPSCFFRRANGRFVIAGQNNMQGAFLIETDSSANTIWMKTYQFGYTPINCISELLSGGYLIGTGQVSSPFTLGSIITTDNFGNFLNLITYDSIAIANVFPVNGGYTVGTAGPYGNNYWVMHQFHVDSLGNGTCAPQQTPFYTLQTAIATAQIISPAITTGGTYSSLVIPTNRGCTVDTLCHDFIDATISSNEKRICCKIIPQPFHENALFEFSGELHNATISIYDIHGKIIFSQKNLYGKEIRLENSQLKNGLFFYRVTENDNVIVSGKLIAE